MRTAHPHPFPLVRACLLGAILTASAAASAQVTSPPQPIAVENAWARATPPRGQVGAAYLTLKDDGQPDRLTAASTPVAAKAELHENTNEGGVMRMREVPSLPLQPGQTVSLSPGGYHIMLMGLRQPLKQGDTFPLTLTFERAGNVTVQVTVAGPGASGPAQAAMPGMHGGHGG